MTLEQFIEDNHKEIDKIIAQRSKKELNSSFDDNERRLWVLNDMRLYNWARSEGYMI